MRYRLYPYKQGSASASALSEALSGKVLRRVGSTFSAKTSDVVINWGASDFPATAAKTYNGDVGTAQNKLLTFQAFQAGDVQSPQFWTSPTDIPGDAYPVVCRTILNGHSGNGIVIARTLEEVVVAPLYTRYVKKKEEYRVHCGNRQAPTAFSVQRKALRLGYENPDWSIRNHHTGFVYVRSDVNPPAAVVEVALQAFGAVSLDFGAVDVLWNDKLSRAYALEVNTAPGLEGQTVTDYASFFRSLE